MIRFNPEDGTPISAKVNNGNVNKQNNVNGRIVKSDAGSDSVSFGAKKTPQKTLKGMILGFVAAITTLTGSGCANKTATVQTKPAAAPQASITEIVETPEDNSPVKVNNGEYTYEADTTATTTAAAETGTTEVAADETPDANAQAKAEVAKDTAPEANAQAKAEVVTDETPDAGAQEKAAAELVEKKSEFLKEEPQLMKYAVPDLPAPEFVDEEGTVWKYAEEPQFMKYAVPDLPPKEYVDENGVIWQETEVHVMKYAVPDVPVPEIIEIDEDEQPVLVHEEVHVVKYGIPDRPVDIPEIKDDTPADNPEEIQAEMEFNVKYGIPEGFDKGDDVVIVDDNVEEPEISHHDIHVVKYGIPADMDIHPDIPDEEEEKVIEVELKYGIPEGFDKGDDVIIVDDNIEEPEISHHDIHVVKYGIPADMDIHPDIPDEEEEKVIEVELKYGIPEGFDKGDDVIIVDDNVEEPEISHHDIHVVKYGIPEDMDIRHVDEDNSVSTDTEASLVKTDESTVVTDDNSVTSDITVTTGTPTEQTVEVHVSASSDGDAQSDITVTTGDNTNVQTNVQVNNGEIPEDIMNLLNKLKGE